MKKLKVFLISLILLFSVTFSFAQTSIPYTTTPIFNQDDGGANALANWKIIIENIDPNISSVVVQIIPVSMIMNGKSLNNPYGEYNLNARWPYDNQAINGHFQYDYLATTFILNNTILGDGAQVGYGTWYGIYNEMAGSAPTYESGTFAPWGSIGAGIYKIIFSWGQNKYDTMWFEQDANLNDWRQCIISFERDPDHPSGDPILYFQIFYHDGTQYPKTLVSTTNPPNYFKVWEYDNVVGRPKNRGNFTYTNNNLYNLYDIPQDAREDCSFSPLPDEHHSYGYDNPNQVNDMQNKQNGNLSLNLTLSKDVSTINQFSQNGGYPGVFFSKKWYDLIMGNSYGVPKPLQLNILDGSALIISNGKNLRINTGTSDLPGSPDFIMTVKTGGDLVMQDGSTIRLNPNDTPGVNLSTKHTGLILENNSKYFGYGSSEIRIYPGGFFCDVGAIITGTLHLHYMGRKFIPYYCELPNTPKKNTVMVLDSATLQIPNNTTITLDSNSSIILNPSSVIQFGANSKLVLQNGAHIFAQNCTFQSDSTGNPWDGIYLSGGCDTIINCTITNSYNGINIVNKSGTGLNPPTTQISGCTFNNTTNTPLSTGINISNSNNVLVQNNTFSSSPLTEGFISAILLQYCSSYNLDILDNTINNVTNGMSIIQSSPYIERNTINGQASDGTGIILDNSNGTLRYNTINHFSKALVTYYSTAYLFRNNLNYSANNIIDLYQSSAPVLKPVNSGGTLLWLGGNNFLNGTQNAPSGYGIGLNDGSFPSLDSGFNNIVLGGANYMAGDLFSNILPATYNYWGDRPPVDNKFAVSNGSVIDTPDYDGSALPKMNGYELTDIGFGLYDTVYTSSGNSPGADNLFTQAYSNEISHNYATAIGLYKEVVSTYKTSNLVPAAIGRILNCMEKKSSTREEYSQLQGYMLQVRNNNQIPYTSREIAEDLIIKSILRQNLYPYSINDYDSMYVHNEGNNKGIHAMINKLSILSFYHDSSGNHFNVQGNSNQYKLSLLSLLTGKQISPLHVNNNPVMPKEFQLYQNYPNPFNPTTKIKYDLPKEGWIKIKIYDIVGKEIYSLEEYKIAGTYELQFDGSKYASGVYFYRIEADKYVSVKKMVLIK